MLKKLSLFLIGMILSVSVFAQTDWKAINKKYRNSVVLIGTKYKTMFDEIEQEFVRGGTGFFISDRLIMIPRHVAEPYNYSPAYLANKRIGREFYIAGSTKIMIWFNGQKFKKDTYEPLDETSFTTGIIAKVVYKNKYIQSYKKSVPMFGSFMNVNIPYAKEDFAILEVEPQKNIIPLKFNMSFEPLDKIMIIGNPYFNRFEMIVDSFVALGRVSIETPDFLIASIFADSGASGSPLINKNGEILGMVVGIKGSGYTVAIKSKLLKEKYELYKKSL